MLVSFSPRVRIIVPDNATEEQIAELAYQKAIDVLKNDGALSHVDEILDDTECPYGTFSSDKE